MTKVQREFKNFSTNIILHFCRFCQVHFGNLFEKNGNIFKIASNFTFWHIQYAEKKRFLNDCKKGFFMDTLQNSQNYGKLVIRVSAASGAVPVSGASVIIRSPEGAVPVTTLAAVLTDESGLTEPILIPTPPLSESLAPGGNQPFAQVSTEVSASGYFTSSNLNIPIYPGITSIQPVTLVPLPDSAAGVQRVSDFVFHNDAQQPDL